MKKFKLKYLFAVFMAFSLFFIFNSSGTYKAAGIDTNTIGVTYSTHVQNIGWQCWVDDGAKAGTDGKGLRVEALKIQLVNAPADAGITYCAHVQNIGWQALSSDGSEAGTNGKGLRIEALKIKLKNLDEYSVQYRAHVQNIGWQDWVSDGAEAGTDGKGLRVEAIEIRVVKKIHPTSIDINEGDQTLKVGQTDNLTTIFTPSYTTDYNVTWTSSDPNVASIDSKGQVTANSVGTSQITATSHDGCKTATCIITVIPADPEVQYSAHVQNIGWQNPVSDGVEAGTDGRGFRVEALKIKLSNVPADAKISYRAHVQNVGWQNWVSNGAEAGTDGKGLRVEALQIKLDNMPDYSIQYQAHVQNIGWQDWVSDGAEAGTDGKGLRVEALRIKLVKKIPVGSIALNKTSDTLNVGDTDSLSATIKPNNATNKNVNWTSSDSSIASVDNTGKVTGNKEGTVTIAATSEDGNKTATCNITVNTTNNSDVVTFKDKNLESLVRSEINKPTGTLYKSDVANIINFGASGNQIKDLSGIENLTSLKNLDLTDDTIIDISPLKKLTNLQELALYNNNISDISPLSGLTNLQYLNLKNNKISDLSPLSGLIKLQDLHLGANKFSDISPLKSLTNLKSLYIDENKNLSDLSGIQNLTQLSGLSAAKDSLNSLNDLNDLTNLKYLDLQNNQITDISPLKNLINLQYLNLEDNKLTNVALLSKLINLKSLDLTNNQISSEDKTTLANALPNCNINYTSLVHY